MKIVKIILAATAVFTIATLPASGQQALTGMVTKIDRINGTLAIQHPQNGTTGAGGGAGVTEEFKAQEGVSLEKLHAGDKVTVSVAEKGGVKTVTKIQAP